MLYNSISSKKGSIETTSHPIITRYASPKKEQTDENIPAQQEQTTPSQYL